MKRQKSARKTAKKSIAHVHQHREASLDDTWAIILAGGSGTRFWPKSRQKLPKQLIALGSEKKTMLELTLSRLDGLIPPQRRIIVTHASQAALTRRVAKKSVRAVLAEPEARNTAAALTWATMEIDRLAKGKPTRIVSLHADAVIRDTQAFRKALIQSLEVAAGGWITLLGVVPTKPETGYGYIEKGEPLGVGSGLRVRSFREKPDQITAQKFLGSGDFLWNSGMFIMPTHLFLAELEAWLPQTFQKIEGWINRGRKAASFSGVYRSLPKVAIDNAVLEKSPRLAVIPASFGWQDIGSWDGMAEAFGKDQDGNWVKGDALLLESRDCTVETDGPFVAVIGCADMVVVHSKGAILVCPRSKAQEIKKVVEELHARKRFALT
jgi:mannose-1-phosphate guanylyltransferase